MLKQITQSIVKQILMERTESPYLTTEEWAEYVRDCCGKNGEKPPEKDLRTIVTKTLISLHHEGLARQKVSLDLSTSQWKVFREQYTLQTSTSVPIRDSRERPRRVVYITKTGEKYHTEDCEFLEEYANSMIRIYLDEVQEDYGPCGVCNPNRNRSKSDR